LSPPIAFHEFLQISPNGTATARGDPYVDSGIKKGIQTVANRFDGPSLFLEAFTERSVVVKDNGPKSYRTQPLKKLVE